MTLLADIYELRRATPGLSTSQSISLPRYTTDLIAEFSEWRGPPVLSAAFLVMALAVLYSSAMSRLRRPFLSGRYSL